MKESRFVAYIAADKFSEPFSKYYGKSEYGAIKELKEANPDWSKFFIWSCEI